MSAKKKSKKNYDNHTILIGGGLLLVVIVGIIIASIIMKGNGGNSFFSKIGTSKRIQVSYNYNLFDANEYDNEFIIGYNNELQILSFTGKINSNKRLGILPEVLIAKGSKYKITINYVGGSYNASENKEPKFMLELYKDRKAYGNKKSGTHYIGLTLPTKDNRTVEKIFTIKDDVIDANAFHYWIYQNTSTETTFDNYRIQIFVTLPDSRIIKKGDKYGILPAPNKAGYTFAGWYTDLSGNNKITSDTAITKDYNHTIYAHWKGKQYNIGFDYNGGSFNGSLPNNVLKATYGEVMPKITYGAPTKEGYIFTGWFDSDGKQYYDEKVQSNVKYYLMSNIKLIAGWKLTDAIVSQPTEYTITYKCGTDATGTAPKNQKVKIGEKIIITANSSKCKKEGARFSGWFDSTGHEWTGENISSWNYTNGYYGIDNNELALEARWIDYPFTIHYLCGSGAKGTHPNTQTVKSGGSIQLVKDAGGCVKDGYEFVGWYTSDGKAWTDWDITNWNYKNGQMGIKNNTLLLTGKWSPKRKFTIIYNCGTGATGTAPKTQTVMEGGKVTLAKTASGCKKTNATFVNWVDSSGKVRTGETIEKWNSNNNLTLTAVWKDIPKYTITYSCGTGATGIAPKTQTVLEGGSIKLINGAGNCKKDGYEFADWVDSTGQKWNNYSTTSWKLTNGKYGIKNNTLALTVSWNKKQPDVTIKYYCDFANASKTPTFTQTIKNGSKITIKNNSCSNNSTKYPAKWLDPTGAEWVANKEYAWKNINGNRGLNEDNALILTSVPKSRVITSYNSSSLRYWIEKYGSETNRTANKNYIVTHIWVEDAYKQLNMAITPKQSSNQKNEYPRDLLAPQKLMEKEIAKTSLGLENKGLVAINASPMIDENRYWCPKCPKEWVGTARIAIKIHDGKIIRDSLTDRENIYRTSNNKLYMLGQDGYLKYFNVYDSDKNFPTNAKTREKILNDVKPRYTFGFKPVLVKDGINVFNGCSSDICDGTNLRQSICQIDKNNFIFITTLSDDANKRSGGLDLSVLADKMVDYNCKTGFNLDGGGSTSFFYKKNDPQLHGVYGTYYRVRPNVEMLYFSEQ